MTQKLEILEILPGVSLQTIKDGGRSMAFLLGGKKQSLSDRIGFTLRNILKGDGVSEATPEQVKELVDLIEAHRDKIIEILQDKECIKVIVGSSKRDKEARVILAGKVLDEVKMRTLAQNKEE